MRVAVCGGWWRWWMHLTSGVAMFPVLMLFIHSFVHSFRVYMDTFSNITWISHKRHSVRLWTCFHVLPYINDKNVVSINKKNTASNANVRSMSNVAIFPLFTYPGTKSDEIGYRNRRGEKVAFEQINFEAFRFGIIVIFHTLIEEAFRVPEKNISID